jgi:predicted CxxxxCH...CXXCH cytochrome family protein
MAACLLFVFACDVSSILPTGGVLEPSGNGEGGSGEGQGDGGGNGVAYHPAGFGSPDLHGLEFNLQDQDCRSCHGADLKGASTAPSCDSCHSTAQPEAWRSDCAFCHDATPKNLDNSIEGRFYVPHQVHLASTMMNTLSCDGCHNAPADVFTAGHAFDDSPGATEVVLATNPLATVADDTCSNLYCHGNGRADNGTVSFTAAAMTCDSCHAGPDGSAAWSTMSGEHRRHLQFSGVTCADCHLDVTADGRTLTNPVLHIDGLRQTASADLTIEPGATVRCTGACHGENHNNEPW